ncbi:MAG: hypothetical protein WC712_05235 [Candidatus Brocadiia bacterium]
MVSMIPRSIIVFSVGLFASLVALTISPAQPAEWAARMFSIRQERFTLQIAAPPRDHIQYIKGFAHPTSREDPELTCNQCHGHDTADNLHSCKWCHGRFWGRQTPPDHAVDYGGSMHALGAQTPTTSGCVRCHGADLRSGLAGSCYSCHMAKVWE